MKRLLILVLSAALVASAIGMRLTKTDKNVGVNPAGLGETAEAEADGARRRPGTT